MAHLPSSPTIAAGRMAWDRLFCCSSWWGWIVALGFAETGAARRQEPGLGAGGDVSPRLLNEQQCPLMYCDTWGPSIKIVMHV